MHILLNLLVLCLLGIILVCGDDFRERNRPDDVNQRSETWGRRRERHHRPNRRENRQRSQAESELEGIAVIDHDGALIERLPGDVALSGKTETRGPSGRRTFNSRDDIVAEHGVDDGDDDDDDDDDGGDFVRRRDSRRNNRRTWNGRQRHHDKRQGWHVSYGRHSQDDQHHDGDRQHPHRHDDDDDDDDHNHGRRHQSRDEPKGEAGKLVDTLTDLLPDMDLTMPWLRGHLQVGPSVQMTWDLGEVFGGRRKKWWEGPNVCSKNEETESDVQTRDITSHHATVATYCDESETSYKCTSEINLHNKKKSYITTFECCLGFTRDEGKLGCTKELMLQNLLDTVESLNLTSLLSAIEGVQLGDLLSEGNYTIFAPSNEALTDKFTILERRATLSPDYDYGLVAVSSDTITLVMQLKDTLATHIVPGWHKTGDLDDNQLLTTASSPVQIRINKYDVPRRITMANCVPIISADNLATNGVIHVVSEILPIPTLTITELVGKDEQFSTLKTVLAKTGLSRELNQVSKDYTLFAPTNGAFEKLDQKRLEKLLGSENCLRNVLKQHLLPHVICSSIIENRVRTFNTLKNFLHFNRTDDGKLFVDGVQVVGKDLMAVNGVVHIIDEILLPEEAWDLLDIAAQQEATEFLQLVSDAKLTKTMQLLDNVTLFLPSNKAIQELPNNIRKQLQSDSSLLEKVIKYHVVPEPMAASDLKNNQNLASYGSDKTIRIAEYSSFPFSVNKVATAQCAPIRKTNIETCNGIIHIVDKLMLPPQGDVLDVLSQNSEFSTFMSLLKRTGLADQLQLAGPFTIFVPKNSALDGTVLEMIDRMQRDYGIERVKSLLKHHIMHGTLCCAGIFESSRMFSPNELMMDGSRVVLSKQDGVIKVNNVPVKSCDHTATNGVVHAIDSIMPNALKKYSAAGQRQSQNRRYFDIFSETRLSELLDGLDMGDVLGESLELASCTFGLPRWLTTK